MLRQATIITLIGSTLISIAATGQEIFTPKALQDPAAHRDLFESTLPIEEVDVYTPAEKDQTIILENGYAEYAFQDADWPPQGDSVIPTSVNIIFTKYPKERSFWLTDYHWLLAKRLEALYVLDERFNDPSVRYSITLQTSCDNEFEAMQLFHGMELGYRPVAKTELTDETANDLGEKEMQSESSSTEKNRSEIKRLKRFMVRQRYVMDSTVFNAFADHPEWKDAIAVIDWTGSMYGHGAEALLWHAMHEGSSGIQELALFNDGGKKKARKKVIGETGGIYTSDLESIAKTIRLFNKVQKKGNGGDSPENDLEAVITAKKAYPDREDVVLVADNRSCIRDFLLIRCIDFPVHVVLTDTRKGINHQYLNLAWRTGGSLHWEGGSMSDMSTFIEQDSLVIAGTRFVLSPDGWLVPANRLTNGYGFCTRYYRASRKTRKRKKSKRRKEPKCYFTE